MTAGEFYVIRRLWKDGDRIELDLPTTLRLARVDDQQPDIVALLSGPLVLFAITDHAPAVTARELLASTRNGAQAWRVETVTGKIQHVAVHGHGRTTLFDLLGR